MKKFSKVFALVVLVAMVYGCKKPKEQTPEEIIAGVWNVTDVFTNEQQLPAGAFAVDSKLYLDRNDTYLFKNPNGIASAGTWTADADKLTLTESDGDVFIYSVVSLTPERMHSTTNFQTFLGTPVELRYLMDRVE